jgi:uncharacterized membrane protein
MLEIIIALIAMAFIFAYLYKATPDESPYFKLLYITLCLFSLFSVTWVSFKPEAVTTTKYLYNATGGLTGTEVVNQTLSDGMTSFMQTQSYVIMVVAVAVFTILVIMFLWNLFADLSKKKKEDNERGYKEQ